MDFFTIILSSIIIFFAYVILGLAGFGSGLISVPLMLLFLDIKLVVPTILILDIISPILVLIKYKKFIKKTHLIPLVIGALFGVMLGTYFLVTHESMLLKKIFGITVILFALNMLFPKIKLQAVNRWFGVIAGFISGVLGAMFKTSGPPAVIYLNHQIKKKLYFRSTILAYFLISNLWTLLLFVYSDLITAPVLHLSLILIPVMIIGLIIGSKIHIDVSETLFKKMISIILIVSGILLLLL